MVFLLKYHIDWHPGKDPRSSHMRCSTRKGGLRKFAKFTGSSVNFTTKFTVPERIF